MLQEELKEKLLAHHNDPNQESAYPIELAERWGVPYGEIKLAYRELVLENEIKIKLH